MTPPIFKTPVFFIMSLFFITSCSKNENILSETDDDTILESVYYTDSDTRKKGAVAFDSDFILDENRTVVNQVLSQADYNNFITGDGDVKLISKKVYEYFDDDFDFIIILSIEETQPNSLFYGRTRLIQNQVEGLGENTYNNSASYGSEEKLKSIIYMPRTEYIRNGPFLHEIVHAWGNKGFVPSTIRGHWGYASAAGQLGGFDELVNLGSNTYRGRLNGKDGFGTIANSANSVVYGNLELYLMGLIGADELETIQVAVNPVAGNVKGEFTADSIKMYSAENRIAEHGTRVPSVENSQKDFKALTVIVSTEAISQNKINEINLDLENFSRMAAPDTRWGNSKNFWLATQGKASFDFKVFQKNIK